MRGLAVVPGDAAVAAHEGTGKTMLCPGECLRRAAHGDDGEVGCSAHPERSLMGSREAWQSLYGRLCCYSTLPLKPFYLVAP